MIGVWLPLVDSRKLPATCGVYLIRHIESRKEYVGKSVNVSRRVSRHRKAKETSSYLHRAIAKHGVDAFEVCLLAESTEAEVTALEVRHVLERGTFTSGYNLTAGGDGLSGRQHTAETKLKMREARLAYNPFKGQKHSPETLVGISETVRKQKRKISPENRLKMSNAKRGTRNKPHTDLTKLRMSLVKRGVPKPAGFAEKLKGESNPMYGLTGKSSPRAVTVAVWVPGSMVPRIFDTSDEASVWAGCSTGSLSYYCQGKQKAKSGNVYAHLK